jgi:Flp pilus assembly protein TadG
MRRRSRRRGASIIESAYTLPLVFLPLILGTLDVGMGVFRHHTVSDAARSAARIAIVHGSESRDPWGPAQVAIKLTGTDAMAVALKRTLVVPDTEADPEVEFVWLDGRNDPGFRVSATMTYRYHPLTTYVFGKQTWTLSSTSVMTIAH